MDEKEFYSKQSNISFTDTLQIIILFVKIIVGVILLFTAINLTYWSVEKIEQFINFPEKVPLINTILTSNVGTEVLRISSQGDTLIIENGLFFQWLVLIIIVLIIFNVVGRALASIFQCVLTLFSDLEVPIKQKTKKIEPQEEEKNPKKTTSFEKYMATEDSNKKD